MEIIIHGKPLDASQRYTSGIDEALAKKIIDETFAFGAVKEPEALVVEARYWQRTWTSVYTLLLSKTVQDTAGRGSYFAISLIIPQRYCTMVSDVYRLLEKVIKENVLGVYLNSNLQYIVPNFENASAFEKLCSKLQSAYANFEKAYDSSFLPQAVFNNNSYCSIYDCDSLAFVQLLRNKGRVIVTEREDTKDDIAALSTRFRTEAQNAKNDAQAKSLKITELERYVKQLEDTARKASNSESKKLNDFKQQIASLTSQNERINQECKAAQIRYEELHSKAAQAVELLGVSKRPPKYEPQKREKKKTNLSVLLHAINTLLILLMAIGLLWNCRGCSKDNKAARMSEAENAEIMSLNDQLQQKDQIILSLQEDTATYRQALAQHERKAELVIRSLQEGRQQIPGVSPAGQSGTVEQTHRQGANRTTSRTSSFNGERKNIIPDNSKKKKEEKQTLTTEGRDNTIQTTTNTTDP